MINEAKAISIINRYLETTTDSIKSKVYPVSGDDLRNNSRLCSILIDFLGDIYVCSELDCKYQETPQGAEIQDTIHFLASRSG